MTASAFASHSEGSETKAEGFGSHAEGHSTTASGQYSHAEGSNTTASGHYSHADGVRTTASGFCSHASGYKSQTRNVDDYAFSWNGDKTRTELYSSHGKGTYNINPEGGLDGFYVGEKKLSEVISDGVANKANQSDLDALAARVDAANIALEEIA